MFQRLFSAKIEKHPSNELDEKGVDRQFVAEALEARVLFSGAPIDAVAVESSDEVQGATTGEFQSLESFGGQNIAIPSAQTEVGSQQSIILSNLDNLTPEEIYKLSDAAMSRWQDAGITDEQAAFLEDIEISIVDLEGHYIGAAEGTTVYLDWDAAGKDWFIDQTPFDDKEFEFAASSTVLQDLDGQAQYGIDLVSVMVHEMGHVLGLEDIYESSLSGSVMYHSFEEGVRRLPAFGQAEGAQAGSMQGIHYVAAATNDGSGGSPFVTTNENTPIDSSPDSVLTNDTVEGGLNKTATAFDATTAAGAAVVANAQTGTFTYDPSGSSAIQALDDGESLTDTFSYTLVESSDPTSGITLELNAGTGINTLGFAGSPLNTTVTPTGTNIPSGITAAYEFSGTGATRNDFK